MTREEKIAELRRRTPGFGGHGDLTDAELDRFLADDFVGPSNAAFAVAGDSMGWRTVHVVDEHGCLLHSEPVCSYHVGYHPWFENWILAQEVPNQHEYPALLWHPVLGETGPGEKKP